MIGALFAEPVVTVEATEAMWNGSLHPDEEAHVRGAVEKRRREFTAGRLCARRALERLGIASFPLVADEDRVPCWPVGVVGSISHCADYCGVAVAPRSAVIALGLDVESAEPLEPRLAERICTPRELDGFARLPRRSGADWPKLAFSAKEAVYKSYFPLTRRRLAFHDLELELSPERGGFVARLARDDAPSAAGHRTFRGRFASDERYVFTGVTLV